MTKRGIDDLSLFNGSTAVPPASSLMTMNGALSVNGCEINEPVNGNGQLNGNPGANTGVSDSNGSTPSNTSGSNTSPVLNGNVKKIKVEHDKNPNIKSRVIHLRNIPSDTTANDLMLLACPFGSVTKHLLVRSKGQAFIEFESPMSAIQMANCWMQTSIGGFPSNLQPSIRGRHVHCQISNHKELKTNFENNNTNNTSNTSASTSSNNNGQDLHEITGANGDNHLSAGTTTTPSQVIRIMVESQLYPVTIESLYTIFTRVGKVLKIVTFSKNNCFQALIQFGDVASSIQAKHCMDGQPMFPGSNILRIEYSKLQNLVVKYNNDKSRDFTLTSSNGTSSMLSGMGYGGATTSSVNGNDNNAVHDFNSLLSSTTGALSFAPSAAQATSTPFASAASLNGPNAATFSPHYMGTTTLQAAFTNAALANTGMINPNAMLAAAAAATGMGVTGIVMSPVIHVSGLSEQTTPDALFTLFGVYGNVIRVKILFNKKDTALIQMAESGQAQLAISYLDRIRLYGKTLRVVTSKYQVVQMPKEGHQDSGLTKDYTNSLLHRFKRPGSKNYNNIYPPSETLHVSNIPPSISDEELKQSFLEESGKQVAKFKFFLTDRRMALVQFESVEDSIHALIKMHNFKVADHSNLRVSFSKSPV